MKHPLLLLLALTTADTWQPFTVDQRVSVELPAQPHEINKMMLPSGKDLPHIRIWSLGTPEGIYRVMRLPTKLIISRSDTTLRRAFYKTLVARLIANEKGQLSSASPFSTPAGDGIEFTYKCTDNRTGRRDIKHGRALVVDSVTYGLNFLSADKLDSTGTAGAANRRRFFDSITVKP